MSTSFPDRQNQVFYLFTMGGLQNQVFPDLQNVYVAHGGFVSLAQLRPHVAKEYVFHTLSTMQLSYVLQVAWKRDMLHNIHSLDAIVHLRAIW